jgi:hypothetical protein
MDGCVHLSSIYNKETKVLTSTTEQAGAGADEETWPFFIGENSS